MKCHTPHAIRISVTLLALIVGSSVAPATADADDPPACSGADILVRNGGEQAAAGHRRVLLEFSVASTTGRCTLIGYPGVATDAGGPFVEADWMPFGYMGGDAENATPQPVTISDGHPAYAVVEGLATDFGDADARCPTYTALQVTAPDTTEAVTVPASIDTCAMQVHPVVSHP